MFIKKGDKVHIKLRRNFESDMRRHFAGVVVEVSDQVVLMEGYVFLFSSVASVFVRRGNKKLSIISLIDANNIINLLPKETVIEDIFYKSLEERLVVTDGKSFEMDIHEFGLTR